MGCDIHGVLQRKHWLDSKYTTVSELPRGRNYSLFAALADVRNYDNITPLAELRGVPSDLNWDDDASNYDDDGDRLPGAIDLGEHSRTWLTLSELVNWPGWDQEVTQSRLVDRAEYERMTAAGENEPRSRCMDVGGGGVVKTTHADVLAGTAPDNWNYTTYEWKDKLRDHCPTFMAWLEYLKLEYDFELDKSMERYDPAALRIVIGFDS